jgi:hypothetical protein
VNLETLAALVPTVHVRNALVHGRFDELTVPLLVSAIAVYCQVLLSSALPSSS